VIYSDHDILLLDSSLFSTPSGLVSRKDTKLKLFIRNDSQYMVKGTIRMMVEGVGIPPVIIRNQENSRRIRPRYHNLFLQESFGKE
jgi:hypothetical protein